MEIGSLVGRNQTTVLRICDRWMQEGTTDRRGRSHPPQCTTSLENRQIVHMAVTDRSVTSRTVAQHIESVTHHSVSARTMRRRLLQSSLSARCPLLGLPLTKNHRRLRRQWCDERSMWAAEWNEVVFTDESRICLQHHDGRIRVWRHRGERMLNSCVMHRHTGPAPGIMGLATAIFQQDYARTHVARIVQRFFVNHQIELLPWPARSPDLSPIEKMWASKSPQTSLYTTGSGSWTRDRRLLSSSPGATKDLPCRCTLNLLRFNVLPLAYVEIGRVVSAQVSSSSLNEVQNCEIRLQSPSRCFSDINKHSSFMLTRV
ncbi:transposable element Tcb1 transposase [Trichonephila clavipes]|nr:transposable element Tcb1 transposase [Trichonephila clavipes]